MKLPAYKIGVFYKANEGSEMKAFYNEGKVQMNKSYCTDDLYFG